MDSLRRFPLVIALIIVVNMTPIGLAVSAPGGQPSNAASGPLQGTSTPPCPGAAGLHGPPACPGTGARKGQAE
jgi:hypothetical protein